MLFKKASKHCVRRWSCGSNTKKTMPTTKKTIESNAIQSNERTVLTQGTVGQREEGIGTPRRFVTKQLVHVEFDTRGRQDVNEGETAGLNHYGFDIITTIIRSSSATIHVVVDEFQIPRRHFPQPTKRCKGQEGHNATLEIGS